MKRHPTSLVIWKMHTKTSVRCHLMPTPKLQQQEQIVTSVDKDAETLEPLYMASGSGKWHSHCENRLAVPQRVKCRVTIRPSSSTRRETAKSTENTFTWELVHKHLQ